MSLHNGLTPLTRTETIEAIDVIIAEEGEELFGGREQLLGQGVVVVGHSFGSIIATWLITHRPNLVSQLVLIDPVCLLLFLPDVCCNFLYRSPQSIMEVLIAFVSVELTISNTLRRHFWWYEVRRRRGGREGPVVVLVE